ncbi:MAG: M42 family metallopeptidase [Phycisphaerae bacterium]|nr:M42 family metallopeptidase [Phycisphaerae bacterium]
MNNKSKAFLEKFLNTPSPSGFEAQASQMFREYLKPYADKINRDVHGNSAAILNPEKKLKVLIEGHIDEIGMMIKYIDDKGFASVGSVGGMDSRIMLAQRVKVITRSGIVKGVIGKKPIHLMDADEVKDEVKFEDLWLDIGAKDKKDALKLIAVGDAIVVDADFQMLQNGMFTARGCDDKLGVFVAAEVFKTLAKKKLDFCLIAAATVQEEIGTRGAITAAYSINPDVAISFEVGHSSDYPTMTPQKHRDIKINAGPILHKGCNINPVLGQGLVDTAIANKIDYQLRAEPGATPTNARAIQLSRGGVATALIRIPNRYMHSPVEICSFDDIEACIDLTVKYLSKLQADTDFCPGTDCTDMEIAD